MILLVVWSANIDSSALTSKVISNLLNDNTYDAFVWVIVLSIPANSALYKKTFDLHDEESISGESSGRASL